MKTLLDRPIIYLITPGELTNSNFDSAASDLLETIAIAVELKISAVQIREKRLSAKLQYELAQRAAAITSGSSTLLLINDRADVALAAGANGVHLSRVSLPAKVVRESFPKDFVIGASTHSGEEMLVARDGGADFVVFGPVFKTSDKGEPIGLSSVEEASMLVPGFPVVGLGGIDAANCRSVIDAGAAGIAAIRALNDQESLKAIVKRFRR